MDTSLPRLRRPVALAAALLSIALSACMASCTHVPDRATSAIARTLDACRRLSPDGPEGNLATRDDDAWFWLQRERAQASRRLWNPGGIAALEARIARTPEGPDRDCLARALREARAKRIESF